MAETDSKDTIYLRYEDVIERQKKKATFTSLARH